MKKIVVLGSTGVVGKKTLEVAKSMSDKIEVVGLAARRNIDLLEKQIQEFSPSIVAVYEETAAKELKRRCPLVNIVSGMQGICEVAAFAGVELVVLAMVGSQGLLPAAEAISHGKHLAHANKEILVIAGEYITDLAKDHNVEIIPIDSEHSAIFQCLMGEKQESIEKLILTASGGPFLHYDRESLKNITPIEASQHPNWVMGNKVGIDCSTLMNKGFEVIEAKWLFGINPKDIEVVIHPQSVVQSMVQFVDKTIKAEIGEPDMKRPIQFALTYPERYHRQDGAFDFSLMRRLEFYPPEKGRYKCLDLAYQSIEIGGSMPCVLNAANEVLVERFCKGDVSWLSIGDKLEEILSRHKVIRDITIDKLLEVDRETRLSAFSV